MTLMHIVALVTEVMNEGTACFSRLATKFMLCICPVTVLSLPPGSTVLSWPLSTVLAAEHAPNVLEVRYPNLCVTAMLSHRNS